MSGIRIVLNWSEDVTTACPPVRSEYAVIGQTMSPRYAKS
jgi:hypothetical protein